MAVAQALQLVEHVGIVGLLGVDLRLMINRDGPEPSVGNAREQVALKV